LILIVGNPKTYESKAIIREFKNRPNKFKFLDWNELLIPFESNIPDLALIRSPPPLKWSELGAFLLTIIEEFERKNVRVYPSSDSLRKCDKFSTYSTILTSNSEIKVPKTILTSDFNQALTFLKDHHDVISKPLIGGGGKDIYKLDVNKLALMKEIMHKNGFILLQEYIPNENYDIRTIVIGEKTIAQYARVNYADFRHNLKVGGKAISAEEFTSTNPNAHIFFNKAASLSIQLKEIFGLSIFATDFLPSSNGELFFLEVNPFFGFKGTQINVAMEIINYIVGELE